MQMQLSQYINIQTRNMHRIATELLAGRNQYLVSISVLSQLVRNNNSGDGMSKRKQRAEIIKCIQKMKKKFAGASKMHMIVVQILQQMYSISDDFPLPPFYRRKMSKQNKKSSKIQHKRAKTKHLKHQLDDISEKQNESQPKIQQYSRQFRMNDLFQQLIQPQLHINNLIMQDSDSDNGFYFQSLSEPSHHESYQTPLSNSQQNSDNHNNNNNIKNIQYSTERNSTLKLRKMQSSHF